MFHFDLINFEFGHPIVHRFLRRALKLVEQVGFGFL